MGTCLQAKDFPTHVFAQSFFPEGMYSFSYLQLFCGGGSYYPPNKWATKINQFAICHIVFVPI